MFVKFTAELMNETRIVKVAGIIEDKGLGVVITGGMDPVLTGFGLLIVDTKAEQIREIQSEFHALNGGNMCSFEQLRQDEIEEYL